jgi:predicted aldo/keto reductase-like oxidoreductase
MNRKRGSENPLSRRQFLIAGGAAAAATGLPAISGATEDNDHPKIRRYRTLGRTGFEVSDIVMGNGATDSKLVRYAYDHGINYFDTGESYGNGKHERVIGGAMKHMDRPKIFVTTKLKLEEGDTERSILDRSEKCLERLETGYADALFMHMVYHADTLKNEGFHAAAKKLKSDNKVRFVGLSCHGPRKDDQDSMEKVLSAAVEDGRFDLCLMSYNFMNTEEAERVLALCKRHNVGTTAMKTAPGAVDIQPFDPENPTGEYLAYIERKQKEGQPREESIEEIKKWRARQKKSYDDTKPFRDTYGLTSAAEMRDTAIKWVLQNDDMHAACIRMREFDDVDRFVALSGSQLQLAERRFLEEFRLAHNRLYCRHGCSECLARCSEGLPVSTIMRYSYYFTGQGREKEAMAKYARLGEINGARCLGCDAPCDGACPHGIDIQANLLAAHSLLTLA